MAKSGLPMAMNVEVVRQEMLRGIRVPAAMVNKALKKTYQQLDAKETKFFAFQGKVVEQVEVAAHEVQAAATDRIFSLAGLYAREREATQQTPQVAVEVDPVSGVIRLVVGSGVPKALTP